MLNLTAQAREVFWKEFNIYFELIPLPSSIDQQFVRDTLVAVTNDDGKTIDYRRDVAAYGVLIGEYCIKGWRGNIQPAAFEKSAIAALMNIPQASDFIINKVRGIDLYIEEEIDAGKPASPTESGGSEAAA